MFEGDNGTARQDKNPFAVEDVPAKVLSSTTVYLTELFR